MRLQSQRRTRHIISRSASQHQGTKAPRIPEKSSVIVSSKPQWLRGVILNMFPPSRCHISLRFSDFDLFSCISRLWPISLSCPSISCFQNYTLHLLRRATKVMMFEMQENINSSQIAYELALKIF